MEKELIEKLKPIERLEYTSRKSNLSWDCMVVGILCAIFTTQGATLLYIKGDSNYIGLLTCGFFVFAGLYFLGLIADSMMNYKLSKEYTEKAIKNIEATKKCGK